ncbi:MAG: extracellular solute-binding protein [Christensenellales bacterium]
MSKKTWSTILVVVLVVAAIVGIYFATKPAPAPVATATPEVTAAPTAAPTEAPTAEPTAAPTAEPTAAPTDAPTAAPEPTAAALVKQKVVIWHTFTEGQEAYLVKAAADFTASQDKYEVEVLSQAYSGFTDAVYSAVNEGVGPDIIFNYPSEAAKYLASGKVADLSQYIYDEQIGIPGFDESLNAGVLSGEVKGFADGLIHYLPAYTTGPILFYNKTLFDELGLKVPTTWEEMEAAAAVIKEKKNIAAMGTDSLTDFLQMLIMESANSGYIDVANKSVLFDTPEVRAKMQWVVDMAQKGYFALKPSGDYFSNDFNGGTVASYIGSVAGYPYITPNGFTFDMAPMPTTTWYPSWNRGPIVFYYNDDARAEAAYEFVKYFISADVNAGWVQAVNALAPYKATQETEAYKTFIAQDTLAVKALQAVNANLPKAGSLPNIAGAAAIRNFLNDAVIKAAGGQVTLDAAWDEAVTLSNAALQGK